MGEAERTVRRVGTGTPSPVYVQKQLQDEIEESSMENKEETNTESKEERRRIFWNEETTTVAPENQDRVSTDTGRMSFLTVPLSPRRPSTSDVVIEKLQVEKLEGGGLSIAGVGLASHCHITLIVFGFFFLLAGAVLSYLGFSFIPEDQLLEKQAQELVNQTAEAIETFVRPQRSHRQMRIIGPVFVIAGIFMIFVGLVLLAIGRKLTRDEKERRAAEFNAEPGQLESTPNQVLVTTSPPHSSGPPQNEAYQILSVRRASSWMDPTPVEHPVTPDILMPDIPPGYQFDSRSNSPLPDSTAAWLQQSATQPSQHEQFPNQQPELQQLYPCINPNLSLKRVSSPFIRAYYGDCEGTTDIACFPSEDCGIASYPGRVNISDTELQPSNSESVIDDPNTQIFEVREASATLESKDSNIRDADPKTYPVLTVSEVPKIQVTAAPPGSNYLNTDTSSANEQLPEQLLPSNSGTAPPSPDEHSESHQVSTAICLPNQSETPREEQD